MKKVLNASIARIILSLLLLIILSAMVGLVIFAYSFLSKTSEEVGKMQTEATAVDAKIQSLLASKSQLDRNSDTVKKANQRWTSKCHLKTILHHIIDICRFAILNYWRILSVLRK